MTTSRRVDSRVHNARRLRRDVTDAEKKLWRHLKLIPLDSGHFRRQATIGPFYADFACHEHRLVIEVEGGQHNQAATADAARTEYLQSNGYRVLRFWNNEVLGNIDGVLTVIPTSSARSTPH